MPSKKTPSRLKREISEYLAGSSAVKPHVRTSPACVTCSRFHTAKDHAAHSRTTKAKTPRKTARMAVSTKRSPTVSDTPARPRSSGDPAPARPTSTPRDPLAIVLEAVRTAPRRARYGRDNVFVYPVWKKVKDEVGMSLPEFKVWLVAQNRDQNLELVRADLVDDMDPRLVEESEISSLGASFHFIIDRDARQLRGY